MPQLLATLSVEFLGLLRRLLWLLKAHDRCCMPCPGLDTLLNAFGAFNGMCFCVVTYQECPLAPPLFCLPAAFATGPAARPAKQLSISYQSV